MEDIPRFEPHESDSVAPVSNRLVRVAISLCGGDVEAAKDLAQETLCRLYKKEPWTSKEWTTENAIAYGTTVGKNIRNENYAKQKRRDELRSKVIEKADAPVNEIAEVEARLLKEAFIRALRVVPAFIGNARAQAFIQHAFVEGLTHEEIAKKLGMTTRELTRWKSKFYDAIPQKLKDRFFGRKLKK
jgi:RNA polymerase sigma factor (sigma-70 family)